MENEEKIAKICLDLVVFYNRFKLENPKIRETTPFCTDDILRTEIARDKR